MRGKFGSTEFFLMTMKVGELITKVTVPKEMEGWDDLTPEEKFQRDINYKRVKEQIAPYLSNDTERFIGSFIVTVKNHDSMIFENFKEAGIRIPAMLGSSLAENIGILTFDGGEVLVPLDGQHRLAALKFAVSGKDEQGKDIPNIMGNHELANDSCSVIIIRDDIEKSRKIFNKVNRYAKPTSKADNLITGDDDVIAVITREDIVSQIIGTRIVKMSAGNTISQKAPEFTTLATVYEISKRFIEMTVNSGKKLDTQTLPPPNVITLYQKELKDFWTGFLKVQPYELSIHNRDETGDENRRGVREGSLLCKPIVMRAVAEAYLKMTDVEEGASRIDLSEFVRRVNTIDWSYENPLWNIILLQPGNKIITGPGPMNIAARLIAYILGQELEEYELQQLEKTVDALGIEMPDTRF